MLKKGFSLLLAALLMLGLLPMAALAEGEEEEVTAATAEALVAAVGDSSKDKIVFAEGSEAITLSAPLTINRSLTIELHGQTITANYETSDSVPILTVFDIQSGGNLTVKGEGSVKAAALPSQIRKTATPYAFYLAGNAGSSRSLTLEGDVSVTHSGNHANLIAVGSKAALTLKSKKGLTSDDIAVIAVNGATGYSISVHMDGVITAPKALILDDGYASVSLQNTTLNGSLVWAGDEASAPKLSQLAAEGYWAFVDGAAVTDAEFNAAPDSGKNYLFRRYCTVSYMNGLTPEESLRTDRVIAGTAAPAYTPTRDNYSFAGWDPALPATITADGTYHAKWSAVFAVTNALTHLSSDGAATATADADYTATLSAEEGYTLPDSVTVTYTDTETAVDGVSFTGGVLTVPGSSVTAPFTVTGEGVAIPTYTVTLPTDTGFTAAAYENDPTTVLSGGSFRFTVTVADGYQQTGSFAVTANDSALTPDGSGVYTIQNITENQTVAVTGVEAIPSFTVTLPTGTGFTAAAYENDPTTVHSGGSFRFTVTVADGYRSTGSFAVTANDSALTPDGSGVYTIQNITENQTVAVTGVEAIPSHTVTLTAGSGYSYLQADYSPWPGEVTVTDGESLSFHLNLEDGYEVAADPYFAVKVDGTAITTDENGLYTISDIQGDHTVTVEGVEVIPTISNTSSQRLSSSSAKFSFTPSQSGYYWYEISLTDSAPDPDHIKLQINKAACTAGSPMSIELRTLDSAAARYIFVLVETAHGVKSEIARIELPAYSAPAATYSVTLPTGTGFTAAAATGSQSPVTAGGSYSFTVVLQDGYQKNGFAVKANGVTLTADANGIYTISNIQAAQTITVTGVEPVPQTYTVTLQSGTGYTLNAVSGSTTPVAAGGSYSFTVTIKSGYQKSNSFTVKANNTVLTPNNNVYTISNITANQTVSVSGVTATGGGGGGGAAAVTAPSITTTTLNSAILGQAYSQQLTATGSAPITWTYTGSLPDGINLGSTTGLLSGTPTAEGTFRFAVKASNARGTATRQMTLVVTGVSYSIAAGNNSQWTQGSQEGLTFQGSGKESFTVQVDGSNVDNRYLSYSTDKTAVTLSSEYLGTLATGSHTVTLVYKNGNAKGKFSVRANPKTAAPAVTAQPLSSEVKAGDSVTFNVTATGTAPLSFQWQVDKNNGKGWIDVSGGSSASLTVKKVTTEQNGWKYRCVVSNASGKTESSAATLTVRGQLGTVTSTTSSPSPTPAAEARAKRSPIITILGIALGLVVVGLGTVVGIRIYQRKKYDE